MESTRPTSDSNAGSDGGNDTDAGSDGDADTVLRRQGGNDEYDTDSRHE